MASVTGNLIQNTATPPLPSEMTLDDALAFATRLHRIGEIEAAETVYKRVLDVVPEHPDALNFLGIVRQQQGHTDEAIALIQRSLDLQPEAGGIWNNLGNLLLYRQRFEEAAHCFQRCIDLAPADPSPHNNLGTLWHSLGHLDKAEAALRQAVALDAKHIDALNNLGNVLADMGRIEEAVVQYCKSIALMPNNPSARSMLGYAYVILGRMDDAIAFYQKWVDAEPDNARARHHLAACTGKDIPARAADRYIEEIFDGFAATFDAKLSALTYRAPQLVSEALEAAAGAPCADLDILDAGCGTGLCGPLLTPFARHLAGVDLSEQMLAKAEHRGTYQVLEHAELTAFLEDSAADSFDAVVSADTLIYFGDLTAVFKATLHALRPGGWLIFTLESADEHPPQEIGYLLQPHGRYQHFKTHVEALLGELGFDRIRVDGAELRMEGGKPVAGWVVVAHKPVADDSRPF